MRSQLTAYIAETYSADPEKPWAPDSDHVVFRHRSNRKWFAVLMTIPRSRLGLPGEGNIDVINLKCGPILAASLQSESGFFPAWHMNKNHWVTAALDGSAEPEQIKWLLEISWDLTAPRRKTPVSEN